MIKETKKEWSGHCRDCNWSGKRSSDRADAQQSVDNHLKTHPQHKARVLVTGEDQSNDSVSVQDNVQDAWKLIAKRQK